MCSVTTPCVLIGRSLTHTTELFCVMCLVMTTMMTMMTCRTFCKPVAHWVFCCRDNSGPRIKAVQENFQVIAVKADGSSVIAKYWLGAQYIDSFMILHIKRSLLSIRIWLKTANCLHMNWLTSTCLEPPNNRKYFPFNHVILYLFGCLNMCTHGSRSASSWFLGSDSLNGNFPSAVAWSNLDQEVSLWELVSLDPARLSYRLWCEDTHSLVQRTFSSMMDLIF